MPDRADEIKISGRWLSAHVNFQWNLPTYYYLYIYL